MSREEQVVDALLDWHKENRRRFPWRDEKDPYKVLVAEFFLQRTPAARVAEIYSRFISKYSTPESLLNVNVTSLQKEYRELGLVKRLNWLVQSSRIIHENFHGRVPNNKDDLIALPGIGEYTASAILSFAYNVPIEIVDSNVIRVYSRIFNIIKKDVNKIAKNMLPVKEIKKYNEALLDFSALICRNKPKCHLCPLVTLCKYEKINLV